MSKSNGNGTKARALREQILQSAQNTRSEVVPLKSLNLTVGIRVLKAREALDIRAAARDDDGTVDEGRLHAGGIIAAVFEPESGEQVFQPADRDALISELGMVAFEELAVEVTRVNGLPSKATDEETLKNSAPPTGKSATPSSSPSA